MERTGMLIMVGVLAAESMGIDVLWTGMGTGKVVLMLWWGSKVARQQRDEGWICS